MGYGRLGSSVSNPSTSDSKSSRSSSGGKQRFAWACLFVAVFLLIASGISVVVVFRSRARSNSPANRSPSQAMARACGLTQYPVLCLNSLLDFPGALEAGERDLVHIALNMTLHRVGAALYGATAISGTDMDQLSRTAYDDCVELLGESIDQLSDSLLVVAPSASVPPATQDRLRGASDEDVLTWLSGALTNHDTCSEGLQQVENHLVKEHMEDNLKDLEELISNSLAIFSGVSRNKDLTGIPIQNKKRKLLSHVGEREFPSWLRKKDRRLLQIPAAEIQADMVVSKNGNSTHTSIAAAVKAAPNYSSRRIIIYISAGRYNENIKVDRKKTNLMFIGDGKSKTIITGSRSVADHFTTFHTATFAASGAGLLMRDLTIENWAGPEKHQAVALRVGADHSVVYRCNIIGYQDTLYVHSQRQFFRECDVHGTVDFVFGNAAVVLQNCTLWARRPLPQQKNTITAQGRKDPNQNTGISFHACQLAATPELEAARGSFSTYLGRPWRLYSRVVYMLSYMGDHIDASGWLAWNGGFALDTLYYGEYMNMGPGAGVARRVNWAGFRVITMPEEASKFTVATFISGNGILLVSGTVFDTVAEEVASSSIFPDNLVGETEGKKDLVSNHVLNETDEQTPRLQAAITHNIVFVCSEAAPYSKTGGLADVCGSLPIALASRGHRVMVISPRYLNGSSDKNFSNAIDLGVRIKIHCFGGGQEVTFFHEFRAGVDWVFVDHPSYHRPGNPYGDSYGAFSDNQFRFTILCYAACEAPLVLPLGGYTYGEKSLFVVNDWHASLVSVLLAAKYRPYGVYKDARSILVIHNLAHQGVEPATTYANLGLHPDWYGALEWIFPTWARKHALDKGEAVNFLKGAIVTADRILTVSQGYCWEIITVEGGHGLNELLNSRRYVLNGITNGIDTNEWNPVTDKNIPFHYSVDDLSGKAQCKAALQKELGLPIRHDCPLIGFIGRLDYQKGTDLIRLALPELFLNDVQFVMLGSGDPEIENWMRWAESQYRERFRGWVGFNVPVSHRITAACDILLMPSRFEPCGLNQLYAMKYGTVPVVNCTGGLRDTVENFNPFAIDTNEQGTGWKFSPFCKESMLSALKFAIQTFTHHKASWEGLMKRGMLKDFTWGSVATQYEQIFEWAFTDPPYVR